MAMRPQRPPPLDSFSPFLSPFHLPVPDAHSRAHPYSRSLLPTHRRHSPTPDGSSRLICILLFRCRFRSLARDIIDDSRPATPMAQPAPQQPLQRSNTLPSKSFRRPTRYSLSGSVPPTDPTRFPPDDILFYHPNATIVKFEVSPAAGQKNAGASAGLADVDYAIDAVETLPWRSPIERMAAVGSLRIENVAGSTAFLKSGSVVQALLKGCQSWCVDGQSIFVLRIRKLTYYRIELPYVTEDDRSRVESLKGVLPRIIKYESTPCPFKRGFSVELPEEAKTPKKKKAWRPKHDVAFKPRALSFSGVSPYSAETSDLGSVEDTDGDTTDGSRSTPKAPRVREPIYGASTPISIPSRPATRSVTEPSHSFNSRRSMFQPVLESESDADVNSLASSIDSFHSFQSSIYPLPPSPPYTNPPSSPQTLLPEQLHIPQQRHHIRGESEATVLAEPLPELSAEEPLANGSTTAPSPLAYPTPSKTPSSSTSISPADPDSSIRQRITSRRRAFSPLPPPSTLLTPAPNFPTTNLPSSLLQKTCSLVLGPPIQFLVMLIHLATRIAAANPDMGSSARADGQMGETVWSEDDFDMPISGILKNGNERGDGGSDVEDSWCELD